MEFFAPFLFMYELSKVDVEVFYTSRGGNEYTRNSWPPWVALTIDKNILGGKAVQFIEIDAIEIRTCGKWTRLDKYKTLVNCLNAYKY